MLLTRGPTLRTAALGDGCYCMPFIQARMVTAVGCTKSRVVPVVLHPPVKKKLKRALGQQGLEKEAELWGLCPHPSPPVPITYIANWTLGARGHQET